MLKQNFSGNFVVTLLLMAGLIGTSVVYSRFGPDVAGTNIAQEVRVTQTISGAKPESTTYKGKLEKVTTALELLQQQAEVKMKGTDVEAFIIEINGRKADEAQREYWSMYVNGKPAEVGAGSYKLQDGDTIEWKIEQY